MIFKRILLTLALLLMPALALAQHPTGAKASPRNKLMAAPRYLIKGDTPAQFAAIPPQLSMWGNSQYGDCVSAEEAFAKACYSIMNGGPELFISESTVISWASQHGFLNGANLTDVMDAMAKGGMVSGGTTWNDGPYSAIDWTNRAQLTSAIAVGPVKIGIAAGQLQDAVGGSNGWLLLHARADQNIDHSVSLCGYGTLSYCCSACGVPTPASEDAAMPCYLLFTWSTVGVVSQDTLNAICGESWLRNPTTVIGPTPGPGPGPGPTPKPPRPPTRRMADLLADLPLLVDKYQNGTEADKAQVLSLLDKIEGQTKQAKQNMGIAP
jgi:hypothetical protein